MLACPADTPPPARVATRPLDVILVLGHSEDAPGALDLQGVPEWHFHRPVIEATVAELVRRGWRAAGELRSATIAGYADKMADLTDRLNRTGALLVVELHFNAAAPGYAGQWSGTECLHWPGSRAGEAVAATLVEHVTRALGTRSRGARAQRESAGRLPLYILRDTTMPAVILETHFGDHGPDVSKAYAARQSGALARALADGVEAALQENRR